MGFWDELVNAFSNGMQTMSQQLSMSDEQIMTAYYDMMTDSLDKAESQLLSGVGSYRDSLNEAEKFGQRLTPYQYSRLQAGLSSKELMEVQQKLQKLSEERKARSKPGIICGPECAVCDDRCEDCMRLQNDFLESLYQLEQLETAVKDPKAGQISVPEINKITRCSFCGAPIESGETSCAYCGTPYQVMYKDGTFNLPRTALEREKLLLSEAEKTYSLYLQYVDRVSELNKAGFEERINMVPSYMHKYLRRLALFNRNLMNMNGEQIRQGAKHYNCPIAEYITAITNNPAMSQDETLPWFGIVLYQQNDKLQSDLEKEREIQRKNHEIAMEAMRKNHERHMEDMKRQEKLLLSKTPKYIAGGGGGGGDWHCCGNCTGYIPSSNKCVLNRNKVVQGADDSCGFFRSR